VNYTEEAVKDCFFIIKIDSDKKRPFLPSGRKRCNFSQLPTSKTKGSKPGHGSF
jgi:hypothetical protein